jgi:hypothetical protein
MQMGMIVNSTVINIWLNHVPGTNSFGSDAGKATGTTPKCTTASQIIVYSDQRG